MNLDDIKTRMDQDPNEELPQGHEKRFEKRLEEAFGTPKRNLPWLKIAAILIFSLGLGTFGFYQLNSVEQSQKTTNKARKEIPLEEAEYYYSQSIEKQVKLLSKSNNSPETSQMIADSQMAIAELESVYLELQKELEKTGDQRVAAAMINNYKNRIQVLETLIQKITYVNHLKKEKNENKAS